MNKKLIHLMQLLTDKGYATEYDKTNKQLLCYAQDTYGMLFYVFKIEAEALEITSIHSTYLEDDFLTEAREIIRETNRDIPMGQFHLNETGHITFYARYKWDKENGLPMEEVCEDVFRAGVVCRQALFENMLCQKE